MVRSPLTERLKDLTEWIRDHLDRGRDSQTLTPAAQKAWVRRARQFIFLLDPEVEKATGGLLVTTLCDLNRDLKRIEEHENDVFFWPEVVDRGFQAALASLEAVHDACISSPDALAPLRTSSNPYFFDLPPGFTEPTAFVLMPFSIPWSKTIWHALQSIVVATPMSPRLACKRADDLFGHDVLLDIVSAIRSATVVISDITGRNPNVFYELGIAHSYGKRVVLMTQDVDDIPFDIQRFRHVIYTLDQAGLRDLGRGVKGALLDLLR